MMIRTAPRYPRMVPFCLLTVGLICSSASAQSVCLPAPRLLTMMPMGGQVGEEIEVRLTGQYLEEVDNLYFSEPSITAQRKSTSNPDDLVFLVKIAAECPQGVHEARVMTRLGISSSRAFTVGSTPELRQASPNTSVDKAMLLPVNSICNGVMTARNIDHYKFEASKGARIIVDCAARGIDSKLNPVLIVADEKGRDIVAQRRGGAIDFKVPHDGVFVVKIHDLTFQGGAYFFYRLSVREMAGDGPIMRLPSTMQVNSFSWPPPGLASVASTSENDEHDVQSVSLPCDIQGRFFPAADVDTYRFSAKKGETWWIEVASERLGRPTDPSVLIQQIVAGENRKDVLELTDIASPVKVSSNGYSYDGPPYNAGSSDVLGKFEVPADGDYLLKISDLFGGTRSDERNIYRLIIRKAKPDFAVVAWALHMNLRNGDRNALSKPMALRRGTTMPLEVVVIRRDGFDGPIDLAMTELPDGMSAQGLRIPKGQSRGIMLVTAHEGAPRGFSIAQFKATATIDENEVTRPCLLASMTWPVANAWSEIPSPRLQSSVAVSVSGEAVAPVTLQPRDEKVFEVVAGEKLNIDLLHLRRSEFSGNTMSLKVFGEGFDRTPAFDISLADDASRATLDLKTLKTPPGEYVIAFYGRAVAKHRHNMTAVDETKLAQDALQESLDRLTNQKAEVAKTLQAASEQDQAAIQKQLDEIEQSLASAKTGLALAKKRFQNATNLSKSKDIVDIVVSKPIRIRVTPSKS